MLQAVLTEVRLENFRRFAEHAVPLRQRTVIVGPNNAGKSTIIEAIRLISLVSNRVTALPYKPVPEWLDDPVGTRGVTPSLRDLNTDLTKVFHSYGDPPAVVEGRFGTGAAIRVFVGPNEQIYAVVTGPSGKVVTSKAQALQVEIGRVAIQPQVAPFAPNERLLDRETVRRGLDSPLSPTHFRNQLLQAEDAAYDRFVELAEETWPGLQIVELVGVEADSNDPLSLLVRDGDFVGEVGMMGHGLQMWLQVVWFLARNEGAPTIVLDEPDVYLHADLQRKLVRLVRAAHSQVVVATHSVEILAEVEPASILTINSRAKRSRWASNSKGVQQVIDRLGGVHNVQLVRLSSSRRCLLLEGEGDAQVMKRIHDVLSPTSESLDVVPRLLVGGWDGWQRVLGAVQLLRNAAGDAISTYAIFDSDYHPPEDVLERFEEANRYRIRLHIWSRKEIENYLLVPTAIRRAIEARTSRSTPAPSLDEVTAKVEETCTGLRDEAVDGAATLYKTHHPNVTVGTANKWARDYVSMRLAEDDGLVGVAPGKVALARLSAWSESAYGVTVGASSIAQVLQPEEVHPELGGVLRAISGSRELPETSTWTDRLSS